ncbi:MAG: hypothetical protein ABI759_01305 [Candidatus Solibacter sp.]
MRHLLLFLALPLLVWSADEDAWAKLKDVKTGAELRVYKVGSAQPMLVKMDELTDDNLVIIEKNKQVAIPRTQLDRVEARPISKGSTLNKRTTTTSSDGVGDPKAVIPGPQQGSPGAHSTTSTSTSVSFDKPGFEVVYRRQAAPPKKN